MRSLALVVALAACTATTDTSTDTTDASGDTGETGDTDTVVLPFADHPLLTRKPLIVAHRGGDQVHPEATLEAFAHAVSVGANVLEIDVAETSDGEIVVIHDDTVDRTTDGTGPINTFTWDDLSKLDAGYTHQPPGSGPDEFPNRGKGYTIPRLVDLLDAHKGDPDILYSVEIKQASPPIEQDVIDILRAAGVDGRTALGSFSDETAKKIRQLAPDILTTMAFAEGYELYSLVEEEFATYTPPTRYFAAPFDYPGLTLKEEDLIKARALDVVVHVWTVNDPDDMDTLLDWDVDGIITDDPETLKARIDAR